MNTIKAKLSGMDLDEVFAYSTLKIVTIRDRRLGFLHYAFQIAIFAYIIIYTIIVQQRYLKTETPIGSIRATVRTANYANASTLPYCSQNQPSVNGFANSPCAYQQGYDITYPPAPIDSIFITTRIKDSFYLSNPSCPDPPTTLDCAPSTTPNRSSMYYVAGIEDFTIFIEHSVFGEQIDIATTNGAGGLKGTIKFANDTSSVFEGKRDGDILYLPDLLEAANIDTLDTESGIGKSLRYDGLLVLGVIKYSNRQSHPKELKYTYDFKALKGSDVVAMAPSVRTSDGFMQRTVHGIRILFLVTGSIGKFDFPTLLTSIVNGFVLLKLSSTIVDLLLLYVMPEKDLYKKSKFETTEDFSDMRNDRKSKKIEMS
eukprot:TRINITY_DN34006_c0_g1_i1.p1 TRINITY_DN34006_c0_g1~~TRINITY_DN34006_c0_g1_i1.p1  ORF type:complete len:371 (-),score=117.97 TRINITY_DN34006_c0_g1_i1:14-1126(-)